jgi:nucleotide-binding universal stress UspA family protein
MGSVVVGYHGSERSRAALDMAVELVVSPERPAERLHKVAAERGARFIVVGSHGEGALAGSVEHKLLQIAEAPVVVVRG